MTKKSNIFRPTRASFAQKPANEREAWRGFCEGKPFHFVSGHELISNSKLKSTSESSKVLLLMSVSPAWRLKMPFPQLMVD